MMALMPRKTIYLFDVLFSCVVCLIAFAVRRGIAF